MAESEHSHKHGRHHGHRGDDIVYRHHRHRNTKTDAVSTSSTAFAPSSRVSRSLILSLVLLLITVIAGVLLYIAVEQQKEIDTLKSQNLALSVENARQEVMLNRYTDAAEIETQAE